MAVKKDAAKDTTGAVDVEVLREQIRAEERTKILAEMANGTSDHPENKAVKLTRGQLVAQFRAFMKTVATKFDKPPVYALTAKAYIDDRLLDPESMPYIKGDPEGNREPLFITYLGMPGGHMVPHNDSAKAVFEAYPPSDADPIADLSVVGDIGTDALAKINKVG